MENVFVCWKFFLKLITHCLRSKISGGEFLRSWHNSGEIISFTASRISDFTSLVISLAKSFKYSTTSVADTLSFFNSSALWKVIGRKGWRTGNHRERGRELTCSSCSKSSTCVWLVLCCLCFLERLPLLRLLLVFLIWFQSQALSLLLARKLGCLRYSHCNCC